jgi:hypothetical protein
MTLRETVTAVLEAFPEGIPESKIVELVGERGWTPDLNHLELHVAVQNSIMALHQEGTVALVYRKSILESLDLSGRGVKEVKARVRMWKLSKFRPHRSIDAEWNS